MAFLVYCGDAVAKLGLHRDSLYNEFDSASIQARIYSYIVCFFLS